MDIEPIAAKAEAILRTDAGTAALRLQVAATGGVDVLDGDDDRRLCCISARLLAAVTTADATVELGRRVLAVARRERKAGEAAGRARLQVELGRLLAGE